MQIDIITIFPHMFDQVFEYGIPAQANKSDLLQMNINDLRDYTHDKHRQVDDRPFGGGPGMVLKPEPLFEAVEDLKRKDSHVILLTPKGKTFNQEQAEQLAEYQHIILICGRYEGVDQRVIDTLVDKQISIGNYVLSGGEFPAMVVVDAVTRLIPGAIKNEEFGRNESFSDPKDRTKLDYPVYTRPEVFRDMEVPGVLLQGNHDKIREWRDQSRSY